jgi:predicted AlkP superfamily phosphohydrolase/phosphomutase
MGIRRMRPGSSSIVHLLLAAWASIIGCGGEVESGRGRVLLVGVDGASPELVRAMRASGDLPHFEALARAGASGELQSEFPLLSPRIWTTVATGRDPSVHGVESWVRKDADGSLKLYSSADRDVPAAWNILSEAGLRVGVVNWLMTHPPEKIAGVMISDHALPDITEKRIGLAGQFAAKLYPETHEPVIAPTSDDLFAYPQEWAPRFAGYLQANEALTDIRNPFQSESPDFVALLQGLSRFYQDDQVVTRAALDIEAELDPDLLMVYLPGIDRISHFLWSAEVAQESLPEALRLPSLAVERNRESLRDYYRFVDALLGRLLERYGPDDFVLVVSDHGFEAAKGPGDMPGIHESKDARDGILYARAPGIEPGSTVEGVGIRDVLPTLLAWYGLPLAEDMPGRVALIEAREDVDPVPSYDALPIERIGDVNDGVEDAVVDQLRALGYVD